MKKLKLILAGILCFTALENIQAQGSDNPLWMRYCAISPDGSTIAFSYKGDLFTVPVTGGRAYQVTSNPAYDYNPVWSPDSKKIAFASDRIGSFDVFVVGKEGGEPIRLTTNTRAESPVAFIDNDNLLFESNVMPSAENTLCPLGGFSQLYRVNLKGGRPVMYSSFPMEMISFSKERKSFLYQDIKGFENKWRKHHTSSVTRDIWHCTIQDNAPEVETVKNASFVKITDFKGEDRNPVMAPDGKSFYYLSESDGTLNIYKSNLAEAVKNGKAAKTQITKYSGNPVRFLSIAENGTLCYGYNGEIYTMKEGSAPIKLKVNIVTDKMDKDLVKRIVNSGAVDLAVSKDGKQVAFLYHGDVYVTSTEYKTTKQITCTPEQERNIDFAPDGRSITYSSERNGLWQVYKSSIVNKEEKFFPYATELKEERVTNSDQTSFQPKYSPDGKEIAFLENREVLRVINLATKTVRTVLDGKYNYSYSDGDYWYQWSPNSKWFLCDYCGEGGKYNTDVALVDASGNGVIHNLTNSGYDDSGAKWVLGGKAMIWQSDRAGYRSHGSWGSEGDIYIMFFDLEAYEKFKMSKEELALYEEAEKAKKSEADSLKTAASKNLKSKKGKEENSKVKKDETKVEPLKFDLDNINDRIVRLTVNSSNLGDAILDNKGEKLYYKSSFEEGFDLWVHDLKEDETKILLKDVGYGEMITDKEGKTLYMNSGGNLKKINMSDGKITPMKYEGLFEYRPYAEREYIFKHAWQQVKDKFYDPTIRNIDWAGYRDNYYKFLPYINNNYDFAEMLSELLGELNGSHTGARYSGGGAQLQTAALGVFFDETYLGDGLKIKEIIKKSPLDVIKTDVKAGCIIEKIDGQPIKAGEDYFPLLEGKSGKKVLLSLLDPSTGKRFNETIKAISYGAQSSMLYDRWVENCKKEVEKLSAGRIGYIHVQGMNSASFRVLYKDLLGRYRNADAVIIDTRCNGGGWLHDDIVTLLSGKQYATIEPRGKYMGKEPFNKWTKPSCMLVNECNYSDAYLTPWAYQTFHVGKLVGAPVAGTGTAVWWESQIDPSLVFGIPQMGMKDNNGNYLENHQIEPEIEVYNSPVDVMNGIDGQLKAAVKCLQAR